MALSPRCLSHLNYLMSLSLASPLHNFLIIIYHLDNSKFFCRKVLYIIFIFCSEELTKFYSDYFMKLN